MYYSHLNTKRFLKYFIGFCVLFPFFLSACQSSAPNKEASYKPLLNRSKKSNFNNENNTFQKITAARGLRIIKDSGCFACHSTNGSNSLGPTWKGLFGSKVLLQNGSTIIADSTYIAMSIKHPDAMLVGGYGSRMPQFNYFERDQIRSIIVYIKSVKSGSLASHFGKIDTTATEISVARGHKIAASNGCFSCHTTNGTNGVGPTWKGLYGRKVRLRDNSTVTADKSYMIVSIADPGAMIVKSYSSLMPKYSYLGEDRIKSIIAYMQSISKNNNPSRLNNKAKLAKFNKITAARGHKIAQSKGCFTCHSINGSRKIGPTWKNLYGRKTELKNGSTIIADSAYIAQSITHPGAKVVQGFRNMMPKFSNLSKDQIDSIIAYIKSISNNS